MTIPKLLICSGTILVFFGALFYFFPNALAWFGNLPGDIRLKGEKTAFFFPLTSMLLVSVVLTVALNVFFRVFR